MFRPLVTITIAAFALAACAGPEADLDGDLDVGGTDPAYWTVEIRKATGKALISILGEASFEGSLPVKSRGEGGAFLMTSATPKGEFVMNFAVKECFDGLAETARPWTVTVNWNGETLNGCAFALPAAAAG
jgi:uncharacterized membrane protein